MGLDGHNVGEGGDAIEDGGIGGVGLQVLLIADEDKFVVAAEHAANTLDHGLAVNGYEGLGDGVTGGLKASRMAGHGDDDFVRREGLHAFAIVVRLSEGRTN